MNVSQSHYQSYHTFHHLHPSEFGTKEIKTFPIASTIELMILEVFRVKSFTERLTNLLVATCCISFLFDQYRSGWRLNKTGRQSAVLISHSYSCCSARAFVSGALMENNNCPEWHVLLIFRPSCYRSFALLHVPLRAEWFSHRYVCGDDRRRENYFRSL